MQSLVIKDHSAAMLDEVIDSLSSIRTRIVSDQRYGKVNEKEQHAMAFILEGHIAQFYRLLPEFLRSLADVQLLVASKEDQVSEILLTRFGTAKSVNAYWHNGQWVGYNPFKY